jgi:putative redox protein
VAVAGELSVRVELQEKVRFVGQVSGDQSVVVDYPPPLGEDKGARGGLELLLLSLAACVGQTVVVLLQRMHQPVARCSVEARGTRREEHPTVLTEIALRLSLSGSGLDRGAVARALEMAETTYCPVWAMLKGSTRVTHTVEVETA